MSAKYIPKWKAAKQILEEAGEALHYQTITSLAVEKGLIPPPNPMSRKTPWASLRTEMSRKPTVFEMKGNGYYKLRDDRKKPFSARTARGPVKLRTRKIPPVVVGQESPTEVFPIIDEFSIHIPREFYLRPKFYIHLMATLENLMISIEHETAGFPEGAHGRWAFLDIDEGDYYSFYHSFRLYDLYRVVKKYIPREYAKGIAVGNEEYDPVPVCGDTKWKAVKKGRNRGNHYFPYRLRLKRIKKTEKSGLFIFKNEYSRLGANLVSRMQFGKSHFQVPLENVERVFGYNQFETGRRRVDALPWFITCEQRMNAEPVAILEDVLTGRRNPDRRINRSELYLQAFSKKCIETTWDELATHLGVGGVAELLSEQAVLGGKVDLVATANGTSLFIEVKNSSVLSRRRTTAEPPSLSASAARDQVTHYKSLWETKNVVRAIMGKSRLRDNKMRVARSEDGLYAIELDANTEI